MLIAAATAGLALPLALTGAPATDAAKRGRHALGVGPNEVVTPFPGRRAFGRTSVWNRRLPRNARLDPASRRLSRALADQVRREAAVGTGPWINTTRWSVPVYTVGADVATVRVQLDNDKPQLQRDFEAVPIPRSAVSSNDTDQALAIYQPATDTYWDFYRMHRKADGWHATYGGKMRNASSNPGHFPYPYGASASGLPLLAGLMTIRELKSLKIDHALALAVPTVAADVITWPAQRSDGRTFGPRGIPEGTHFRIDPSLDVTKLGLSPIALAMARAAQRYGIIVRDGASNVTFYAEDPTTTGGNPYPALFGGYPDDALRGFPWGRLQVVAPRSG